MSPRLSDLPPESDQAAAVTKGEARKPRGNLKIFFGYATGIGKTFAMLLEARRLKDAGIDVVVGHVEPHGRPETEALLESLEILPALEIADHGATLREFDLDVALNRRPAVIVVDELAHTNPPELRHTKRWQDIEELLASGIGVLTTCNVQHIESLNDVVSKISGVIVRETVPDDVFTRAEEVALIDLPPEELLQRFRAGQVYVPAQMHLVLENLLRKDSLLALRELALRRAAERVHADVETARIRRGTGDVWATSERLLVCVGPSPTSARVIRAAKRLANSLQAELLAIHVETSSTRQMTEKDRARLLAHLRLAERLGAETAMLTGEDLVSEALDYARRRNVTKIVIGKPPPPRGWFKWRPRSPTDRLIRDSGAIDVYVIRGEAEPHREHVGTARPRTISSADWWGTAAILALVTAACLGLSRLGFTEANIVMTYLLCVFVIGYRFGRVQAIAASVATVLLFDVLFTPPYYTLVVHDAQYMVTFLVMLLIGLATTALTSRNRNAVLLARKNERRTRALYHLGRKLAGISGQDFIAAETERSVAETFDAQAAVLLPRDGQLKPILDHRTGLAGNPQEVAVAQWVFDHGEMAGRGTDTRPAAQALYLPLASPHGTLGVLAVRTADTAGLLLPETRQLLTAFSAQVALALERDRLTLESESARVQAETEQVRSILLASVSHDIRTPLAVIAGASSTLLAANDHERINPVTRRELLNTIFEEADRLARMVDNLLRLTQLSAGKFQVDRDWHPVEEVIGSALRRLEHLLSDRPIEVDLPAEMLWGWYDAVLLEQVLMNLLENAARHTPPRSPLGICGWKGSGQLVLEVADRGSGVEPADAARIFATFERGPQARADSRGVGLGLAICRAICEAHGGRIGFVPREGGGSVFRVELPAAGSPPQVDVMKA